MKSVRALSLVAQIHEAVRARIAAGELAPGAAVNIADLARQLEVSATPVREALARLAAEGQLRFVDNIGYSVPPLPDADAWVNWAMARVVVESNALRYILGPLDSRTLDEAEAVNERIRAADFGSGEKGVRQFSELNWRFHALLIGLARNPLLDDLHARLYAAPQFSRIFLGRGIPSQSLVAAEHTRILRALKRGDRAAAADALREHVIDSLERDARLTDLSVSLKRLLHGQSGVAARSNKSPRRSR